jgi:hypothetical protein
MSQNFMGLQKFCGRAFPIALQAVLLFFKCLISTSIRIYPLSQWDITEEGRLAQVRKHCLAVGTVKSIAVRSLDHCCPRSVAINMGVQLGRAGRFRAVRMFEDNAAA